MRETGWWLESQVGQGCRCARAQRSCLTQTSGIREDFAETVMSKKRVINLKDDFEDWARWSGRVFQPEGVEREALPWAKPENIKGVTTESFNVT